MIIQIPIFHHVDIQPGDKLYSIAANTIHTVQSIEERAVPYPSYNEFIETDFDVLFMDGLSGTLSNGLNQGKYVLLREINFSY
jgi:hypothetical protein